MTEDKKNYYAIIPANIRYDDRLKPNAKLLYGEITALTNEKGYCWATNQYFADLYGVSKQSISNWINQLRDLGYIDIEIVYKEGSKEILNRYIKIVIYPIKENLNTPIQKKLKDNNTIINTTFNTTLDIYTSNPELKESILEFIKMRKNIKKPLTEKALELILKKLDKLSNDDSTKIEILNQSIMNCWQSIFELKEVGNGITGKNTGTSEKYKGFRAQRKQYGEIQSEELL